MSGHTQSQKNSQYMLFMHLRLHFEFTKLLIAIVDTVHAEKPIVICSEKRK